jgi:hypothetical protein
VQPQADLAAAPDAKSLQIWSENADRNMLGRRVRKLLDARRFERLEQFGDSLRERDLRFPSGSSYLLAFFNDGFSAVDTKSEAELWLTQLTRLRSGGWRPRRPWRGSPWRTG